ncbi:Spy/CpxP family protein refolding chaperone [Fuchsiella alkaliacetigena]|uniref:Spy/CpxP family protein refolding chaperone n=1 Tax=Fuchsiella alkaliacetigena TaxID=957042 RepID=UPI002009F560|nr:Spy/CpxP family protein refolding chaperone [Fuchsiella alkaliacetigena]MCK8824472.1 Spy/CpxP family protein refolding chaperone [Fuchsiella alkaliacetigena]
MKKTVSVVLILVLVLGLSSLAFARIGSRGQGMMGRDYGMRGVDCDRGRSRLDGEDLNLTEEQERELEDLKIEYYEKSELVREEMWDKRAQLRELYYDSEASDGELRSLQNEIDGLRAELMELKDEQRLSLREILTAEQLEKLDRSSCLYCDEDYTRGRSSRGSLLR